MAHKKRHHHKERRYRDKEEYAGIKLRTKTETEDFHMLSEDRSAIANMPQNVIMKSYAKAYHGAYENLNDTITGVDHQMREDSMKQKKGAFPEMY